MIEPKIKDQVILLLSEGKGSAEVAKKLEIEQSYVVAAIREIESRFPGGFLEHKGYGDDILGVSLHPKYEQQLVVFVREGGFEAEDKKRLELEQKREKKVDLEISNLQLAVRAAQEAELNAEKAEARAKNADRNSVTAIIIAALVLLFEIYKYYNSK